MAVRDRNLFAWQAYVLAATFISVGLLLGMFFLWRSYSDLNRRFTEQASSLETARSQFQTSDGRVDRLLSMLGYGEYTDEDLQRMSETFKGDEKLGQVETDFAAAMKLFPPGQADNEKNLIKLPTLLLDTIRLRNEQIASAREQVRLLEAEKANTVDSETEKTSVAEQGLKVAEADLAAARQEHATAVARLNKEKEDAFNKFDQYKATVDKQLAVLRQENTKLASENKTQLETIQEQMDLINNYRNPDFAAPQGDIVKVYNRGTRVWINLGSADGLRVGVPFSVIDESAINITEATPKAQLRVTEVEEHQALATITGGVNYRNPIVPGDRVYSPLWRPGRKVGVALVGVMDMNGDRRDDTARLRELIELSGGQVDAAIDQQGTASGPGMSPTTSFLVLGTDLTVPANASPELRAQQQAKATNYAKFMAEARRNGIQEISLDKLLGYLKTGGANQTIPLGDRQRAEDFPLRSKVSPPASRGSVSEIYTERQPGGL